MDTVSLANPSDEAEIRRLLWATPMCGIVDLVFAREPDYFALGNTQGELVQTLVARRHNKIVGLATRAIRRVKVNGIALDTGYLADFRLHPGVRGGYILAKGYKLFQHLHADQRASIYTALVVDDNRLAMSTLLSGRANFPACHDLGRVFTPLILVNRYRGARVELEAGCTISLPDIVEVLNRDERQFAPVYSVSDFTSDRFPGFDIDDFLVLRRHGEIVGVAGLWVQTGVRQTVALSYTGVKKVLLPLVNRFFGLGLPAPGTPFKSAYMAFVQTEGADDYEQLVRACLHKARKRGITHLVAGLHERDPRSHILKKFSAIPFAGRMFAIKEQGQIELDDRIPFMEPATL